MGNNEMFILRELYETFSQKLINIEEKFKDQVSETGNDILFHYTDVNALKSILKKQTLWFSNAGYLNDSSELQYIVDLIYDVAKDISKSMQKGDIQGFFKELLDLLTNKVR